jgi:hypothetical protein
MNIQLPTADMPMFIQQLKQPNISFGVNQSAPPLAKIQKNIVIASSSDAGGCYFYRVSQPLTFIHNIFARNKDLEVILSNPIIMQHDILMRTKSFFIQRLMAPQHVNQIKTLKEMQKKYGYKLIYEVDDFLGKGEDVNECIPDYNMGKEGITDEVRKHWIEIMSMCDLITAPSQFLLDYITNKLNVKVPTYYLPNVAAMYSWGSKRKKPITEKIKVPKILVASSPCHYSNEKKLKGDFEGAWGEYLIKNARYGKIEVTIMGGLPWFMESVKKFVNVIDWVTPYMHSQAVKEQRTDFLVAPLIKSYFNASKSDIKYVEASASSNFFIGSVFNDPKLPSPYEKCHTTIRHDCSVKDIEELIDRCSEPEEYNKGLQIQYKWMKDEGRYLESAKNIQRWTSIL